MFRATNDAHIGLMVRPRRVDGMPNWKPPKMYEIVLGGWGNSQSAIRRGPDGQEQVQVAGSPCNPNGWSTVTIAFINGNQVVVSLGETPCENVFMEWKDPEPFEVNFIAVMTGWGSEGNWLFNEIENPRDIEVEHEDFDECIMTKDGFGDSFCENSADWCSGAKSHDLDECCSCTCDEFCEPYTPDEHSTYLGCFRDDGNRDFGFGP